MLSVFRLKITNLNASKVQSTVAVDWTLSRPVHSALPHGRRKLRPRERGRGQNLYKYLAANASVTPGFTS